MIERIGELEKKYVLEVLATQFRGSAGGAMIRKLEEVFAGRFQSDFAISFANGTATMHATLAAAGVGPGHEVIVPPLTMASTAFCVLHTGATPIFADIDRQTWTLDPRSVAERLTVNTRAVIPVALYGLSADLDPIMDLARAKGLFVLEDTAQCFLGRYRGRVAGSIGHAASFSFQSSKHITSGEGGMTTTSDPHLATEIRRMSSLGYAAVSGGAGKSKIKREDIQDPGYIRHSSVGWNYRLSELCAAVILAQVERIDELVAVRTRAAQQFAKATAGCDWLAPQHVPEHFENSYWTYACLLSKDAPCTWHEFRKKYMELGGDGFYGAWAVNYLEPAFRGKQFGAWQTQVYEPGLCPVAEDVQPRLMQFKTNYFDHSRLVQVCDAMAATIEFFNRGDNTIKRG